MMRLRKRSMWKMILMSMSLQIPNSDKDLWIGCKITKPWAGANLKLAIESNREIISKVNKDSGVSKPKLKIKPHNMIELE